MSCVYNIMVNPQHNNYNSVMAIVQVSITGLLVLACNYS